MFWIWIKNRKPLKIVILVVLSGLTSGYLYATAISQSSNITHSSLSNTKRITSINEGVPSSKNSGWFDDNFTSGWVSLAGEGGVVVEGGVLDVYANFTSGERNYYLLQTDETFPGVNSTEYPYAVVRWKSTEHVARLTLSSFEPRVDYKVIVESADGTVHRGTYGGGYNTNWTTTIYMIPPNKTIDGIDIGVDSGGGAGGAFPVSGEQHALFDYIKFLPRIPYEIESITQFPNVPLKKDIDDITIRASVRITESLLKNLEASLNLTVPDGRMEIHQMILRNSDFAFTFKPKSHHPIGNYTYVIKIRDPQGTVKSSSVHSFQVRNKPLTYVLGEILKTMSSAAKDIRISLMLIIAGAFVFAIIFPYIVKDSHTESVVSRNENHGADQVAKNNYIVTPSVTGLDGD